MKPHNVLGQCFLNILVLSCDLEPIRFEESFRKRVGTERASERPAEWCSLGLLPTQATHQEKQLRYTRIRLDTRAVAHSEYPGEKQLDTRVPVASKRKVCINQLMNRKVCIKLFKTAVM